MLNFSIIYNTNEGLIFNPSEFIDMYLFGIPLTDKRGNTMSIETISNTIKTAQVELENYLAIKFIRQVIEEKKDFVRDDWVSWGYIRTSYPVNSIFELKGFVNTVQQMDLPAEWLSIKKSNDNLKFRHVQVVPVAAASISYSTIYNGVVPLGFFSNDRIPNYWNCVYVTGFEEIPADLYNFVGKLAAINVFHLLGDLILGTPGLTSKSISIDGLSQTYSTQSGYKTRIDGYLKDLETSLPRIYTYYRGITCLSL